MPISRHASSPARTHSRSTSTMLRSCTSSIRVGWIRPSATSSLQGQPGGLAADRVEAGQQHRLRGVVDDQVDAGDLLEGPDVAALPADDPALHVVAGQVHDGDDRLGGLVGGEPLDRAWRRSRGRARRASSAASLDVAGDQRGLRAWPRARPLATSSALASSRSGSSSRRRSARGRAARRGSSRRARRPRGPAPPGPAPRRRAAPRARSAGARGARCPGAARAGRLQLAVRLGQPRSVRGGSRSEHRRSARRPTSRGRRATTRSSSVGADPGTRAPATR